MSKIIVAAAVIFGAGLAASHAGTYFGFTFGVGRGYEGPDYPAPIYGSPYGVPYQSVQPSYGYSVPAQPQPPYGYSAPVQPSYGYYAPAPVYRDGLHRDLHQELRAEHRDLHEELGAQHAEEHQQLANEAAAGVPWWELALQHRAEHYQLDAQHRGGHGQLRDEHAAGHDDLGW